MSAPRRYLDHNATTPLWPEVRAALGPFLEGIHGNPSSVHAEGRGARLAIDDARAKVAKALGATPSEIVFTGGGTEADDLAVLGAVRASVRAKAGPAHVVVSAIEHPAVLRAAKRLSEEGVLVTTVAPAPDGRVRVDDVAAALLPSTRLVSVMLANNETGAVQPVAELAAVVRAAGVLVHTDAVQAVGKVPVDVAALGVDLLSVSGHKLGAMQGVGALYARRGVVVEPLLVGGGQERGRRAGTENVLGVVSLGAAMSENAARLGALGPRVGALRDRLEAGLRARIDGVTVHGEGGPRVPNTSSLRIAGCDGESLLLNLDLEGIAASSGAACASGTLAPSHVLLAMGLTAEEARGSLRFSLGRGSDDADVDAVLDALPPIVARLRSLGVAGAAR